MAEDNLLGSTSKKPGRPKKSETVADVVAAANEAPETPVAVEAEAEPEVYTLTKAEMKSLRSLLAKNQEAREAASNDATVNALIEAIRESRKPYKSDADKANEEAQREQMRKMIEKEKRNKELERRGCRHLAGSNALSHREADTTAIGWHEVLEHLWIGICTVCQREFWPNDPDYGYWRRRRSYNTASRSGERQQEVDTKTYVDETHNEVFGSRTGGAVSPVPQFPQFSY